MILSMTKPSSRRLTDPDIVASRLRGHMGERKIARSHLSGWCGINQSSLGQKLDGKVPFTYDEMDRVLEALELSWTWLVAGVDDDLPSYPPNGAGGRPVQSSVRQVTIRHKSLSCGRNQRLFSASRNLAQESSSGKVGQMACSDRVGFHTIGIGQISELNPTEG